MNLNRLHNIFGRRGRLDRKDIDDYAQATDPEVRNAIEQKAAADEFGSDALEGWEQLGYNTSTMTALDKKFLPKSYTGWYVLGGTIIAGSIVAAVFFTASPGTTPPTQTATTANDSIVTELLEDQQITLDESDVMLPTPIEQMNDAPEQEQVQPHVIKHDFHEMDSIRIEEPPIPIAELPVIDIDIEKIEDLDIIRAHEYAKEIYLHDLKLVDYSNYRSEPQVKTRQMVLSGTPANKEGKESEELDPIWRNVDIPYMEFINKSMRIFGRGNYKKALSRFETVLGTYELDVNANFYAGICLYNLGEYDLAISNFEACLDGPYSNFDEESLWMTALSHEHLGRETMARKLFIEIRDAKGFYASQANAKLK